MKNLLRVISVAAALFAFDNRCSIAAEQSSASAEKQRKLIAVLQSDAAPAEKAITCKQLAIYGTKDAVAALAPLLENKDLTSWARIALEAIPGAESEALMGRLH